MVLPNPSGERHNRVLPVAAVAIVFVSLCLGLGRLPLLQPDEGRNAEVAREMKESGAWLVPTYNGVDYLDKPAFYFKAVALSLAAFGDNETAARLPSALFAVGLVAMIFAFCRRVYAAPRVAWIATIVVATIPLYLMNARIVIFDTALAFFVCGAVFAGHLAEESEGKSRRNWYLLGAASAGAATLVKGPVGFAVPILVLLVSQRFAGRRGVWKRLFAPLNVLVFFAITLPWFIGLCVAKRDFFHYGIVDETFNRFTSAEKFKRGKPFYYFPLLITWSFLPWSVFLPEAAMAAWRQRWTKHRADILCVVWSIAVIIFFSISQSKQPGYILTVPVSCGILLARLIDAAITNPAGRAARVLRHSVTVLGIICLVSFAAAATAALSANQLAAITKLPMTLAVQWSALAWPMAILAAVFATIAALAVVQRSGWLGFCCFAFFCPLFIIVNVRGFELATEPKSGRAVADAIPSLPPGTEIATLECFPSGLPFYLRRTVTLITEDGEELTSNYIPYRLAHSAPWPSNIVRLAEVNEWLKTRQRPIFLIARDRNKRRLENIAAPYGATVQPVTERFCGSLLPAPHAL